MKTMKTKFLSKARIVIFNTLAFVLFVTALIPMFASAQTTNPVSKVLLDCTNKVGTSCGWSDLIALVNAMISYAVQLIGIAFVIALLYAGFLYLTSWGDTSKTKKAREMMVKIAWGALYTLCGWVIVYFILTKLGVNSDFYVKIIKV